MITINDLQFEKFEDPKTPEFSCNFCGKRQAAFGWHYAELRIDEDSTFTVVICSDECLTNFKTHPHIDRYINDRLQAAMRLATRQEK